MFLKVIFLKVLNIYVCVLLILQCTTPFVLKPSISARKNKRKTLLTGKKNGRNLT